MHLEGIAARENEFKQLGCQVVVVSSGTQESGMEWFQKHGFSFPLLIDQNRVFYRQVGLRRSLRNSFCVNSFKYYADIECSSDKEGEEPYSGSDLAVTGGDFIVDSSGRLLYAHHCKNQFDRPDIETLVEFLRRTN